MEIENNNKLNLHELNNNYLKLYLQQHKLKIMQKIKLQKHLNVR